MIGVYRITNSITNEYYIGSSRNVQRRWREHRNTSRWNEHHNSRLYTDMKQYGTDKFIFEIVEEVVDIADLHSREQYYIELYHPAYNQRVATTGMNKKQYMRQYEKTDKRKQYHKQFYRKYQNRICEYNGERLTLNALSIRFSRMVITNPTIEAKKYLVEGGSK